MSNYLLVARRVYCDVNGGNRIKNVSPDHAVEYAVGFFTLKVKFSRNVTGVLAGLSVDQR